MNKINEIFNLSETVSSEVIRKYLDYIVNLQYDHAQKKIIFEALFELADKQWHNYERLDAEIQHPLESWIIKNIDLSDVDVVNDVLGIIARLGLKKVYTELALIAEKNKSLGDEIKEALIDGIEELKNSIDNPWLGME